MLSLRNVSKLMAVALIASSLVLFPAASHADTTGPTLEVAQSGSVTLSGGAIQVFTEADDTPYLAGTATDLESGVDRIEVRFYDDVRRGYPAVVTADCPGCASTTTVTGTVSWSATKELQAGSYGVRVTAFDNDGNYTHVTLRLVIARYCCALRD